MVPIPEGVEREDEEPTEDFGIGAVKNSGGGTGLGSGFVILGQGTKSDRDDELRG